MILPSIDLRGGHAVQLVGGKELAVDAGDPRPVADQLMLAGEIAIVDLDAALGTGDNRALIKELLRKGPARVGGGVRDVETARDYLDAGATRVVIGTRATPEFLSQLPRDRVCVALDAVLGEVVVEGWQTKTGASIEQRLAELLPYASSFLVTFVEKEGRLGGTDLESAARLRAAAGDAELTIAGGVTTPADIAALDKMGANAQIGMALYTGKLD
ncbi:MAG: HisA/HisF-related TIM barrel protein, partial [Myxococcota bacterium]